MIRSKWQFFPSPDRASLHLDRELPQMALDPREHSSTSESDALRDLLNGVHGLTHANSNRGIIHNKYEISLSKGTAFEWDEVKPRVESAIEKFFVDEIEAHSLSNESA